MLPTHFWARSYKCFVRPQRIELRPLTLFYGQNNAGKSALIRLLPLLSDSLAATGKSPLALDSPALNGAPFETLKWSGRARDDISPVLAFGLDWEGLPLRAVRWDLSYYENWKRLIVQAMILEREQIKETYAFLGLEDEKLQKRLSYELFHSTDGGNPGGDVAQFVFDGLEIQPEPHTEPLAAQLNFFKGAVQWLASRRNPPKRWTPQVGGSSLRMSPGGEGVIPLLDTYKDVFEQVSGWYEENFARSLQLYQEEPGLRLTAETLGGDAALRVDFVDLGEGLVQVLPVLTALAALQFGADESPRVLALEEPESHLHPKAQRALASHICQTVSAVEEGCVVLETHSQEVLLGVQLAILDGTLSPEDVALYWVSQEPDGGSDAHRVEISSTGKFGRGWPAGVYNDRLEMARELLSKQQQKRRQEAS